MDTLGRFTDIELASEAELESLLAVDPSKIEPGMSLLARQWPTRRGPLDLLLMDQDGRATVAELKIESSDDMLLQGLDYLAWVHENLIAIKQAFPKVSLDKNPRLVLVARSFSDVLRARCRYLRDELQPVLLAYRAGTHANETLVLMNEVDIPKMPDGGPRITQSTDHRDYLSGDDLRQLWDNAARYFTSLSPQVHQTPVQSYLGFRGNSRLIAALAANRRSFWVKCWYEGEWEWHFKIADAKDLEKMKAELGSNYLAKVTSEATPEADA
jgi:hypothetical protein